MFLSDLNYAEIFLTWKTKDNKVLFKESVYLKDKNGDVCSFIDDALDVTGMHPTDICQKVLFNTMTQVENEEWRKDLIDGWFLLEGVVVIPSTKFVCDDLSIIKIK